MLKSKSEVLTVVSSKPMTNDCSPAQTIPYTSKCYDPTTVVSIPPISFNPTFDHVPLRINNQSLTILNTVAQKRDSIAL